VKIKIAAVNFNAVFADVKQNLVKVEEYTKKASELGVELVLFPEFFTSSMGYSEKMLDVAVNSRHVQAFLQELSVRYNIIIGGSYLLFDGKDAHNLFQLIFPDGNIFEHKKDLPTLGENCYYTEGDTEHILHTPIGDIGVALCWELVRYDTLKRLSQKVDFVLAGTCWADLPDWDGGAELKQYNREYAKKSPSKFAGLLHVPVIHANHCGVITAYDFPDDKKLNTLQMIGATQIINEKGIILAEKTFEDEEGLVISDIDVNNKNKPPADIDPNKFWIEDMPESYLYAWNNLNPLGKKYYENTAKPYYLNMTLPML